MSDRDLTMAFRLTADLAKYTGNVKAALDQQQALGRGATDAGQKIDRAFEGAGKSADRFGRSTAVVLARSANDFRSAAAASSEFSRSHSLALMRAEQGTARFESSQRRHLALVREDARQTAIAVRMEFERIAGARQLARLGGGGGGGRGGAGGFGADADFDAVFGPGSGGGSLARPSWFGSRLGWGIGAAGVVAADAKSARLDQGLARTTLTADVDAGSAAEARAELFRLQRRYGVVVEDTKEGLDSLVATGLKFKAAMASLDPIAKGVTVTGARAGSLADALSISNSIYGYDLAKPGVSQLLLDKMYKAGNLANAELPDLAPTIARVGGSAQRSGFNFDQTLAFIEGLSQIEKQPDRLATLVDSTFRLFSNADYAKAAQRATGAKFFNKDGSRRDGFEVLEDLRNRYAGLGSDQQRSRFIDRAFGNADLDTQRGLQALISGDRLATTRGYLTQIAGAGGSLDAALPRATDNLVVQFGRLAGVVRDNVDALAQRANRGLTAAARAAADDPLDALAAGAGAVLGIGALAKLAPNLAKALGKNAAGTAAGVAIGQGLEHAGLATPVYVVNMPNGGFGGMDLPGVGRSVLKGGRASWRLLAGASLPEIAALGPGASLASAGLVGLAGGAGYGAGWLINKGANYGLTALSGGRDASLGTWLYDLTQRDTPSLATPQRDSAAQLNGTIRLEIDERGVRVRGITATPGVDFDVSTAPLVLAARP